MSKKHPSRGARLKVKRANSHIDTLIADSTPLSKELYRIINERKLWCAPMWQPYRFYLRYEPQESSVDHFGPIIGDVVNNLREAMDYWINDALLLVGPKKPAHFPFSAEWKDLKTTSSYLLVDKAFPRLADFIFKQIKPCRDTNLNLWAATSLCNQNKHNDFIPIVAAVSVNNINARTGGSVMTNCGMGGNADTPSTIIASSVPISIKEDFNISCKITFPQEAVFSGQLVVPTLTNMSEVITQTLDALDAFISPYIT